MGFGSPLHTSPIVCDGVIGSVGHGLWGGGEGGPNFQPYTLQHSLSDRVSQNSRVLSDPIINLMTIFRVRVG